MGGGIKTYNEIKTNKIDHETPRRPITQRNGALGHLLARGAGALCACVCACVRVVFVHASPHLHRLSGPAQWAGAELRGSPSRPALCQAQPRSASCQGEGWERGRGGRHFSMTTRHAQLGLAKPASARSHVLAARVNFSIDSEADREKKSPDGDVLEEQAGVGLAVWWGEGEG